MKLDNFREKLRATEPEPSRIGQSIGNVTISIDLPGGGTQVSRPRPSAAQGVFPSIADEWHTEKGQAPNAEQVQLVLNGQLAWHSAIKALVRIQGNLTALGGMTDFKVVIKRHPTWKADEECRAALLYRTALESCPACTGAKPEDVVRDRFGNCMTCQGWGQRVPPPTLMELKKQVGA